MTSREEVQIALFLFPGTVDQRITLEEKITVFFHAFLRELEFGVGSLALPLCLLSILKGL